MVNNTPPLLERERDRAWPNLCDLGTSHALYASSKVVIHLGSLGLRCFTCTTAQNIKNRDCAQQCCSQLNSSWIWTSRQLYRITSGWETHSNSFCTSFKDIKKITKSQAESRFPVLDTRQLTANTRTQNSQHQALCLNLYISLINNWLKYLQTSSWQQILHTIKNTSPVHCHDNTLST